MNILKPVKERGRVKCIDLTKLNEPSNYETYYLSWGSGMDEAMKKKRFISTIPELLKRNTAKLRKRQAEYAELTDNVPVSVLKQILPPDEYLVITLFFGLEDKIATQTVIASKVTREDGEHSSRQWITQLKAQALKKIHEYKITKMWKIPLAKLRQLLTEGEYEIMARHYGIHTDRNGNESRMVMFPESIASAIGLSKHTVSNIIKNAEVKLRSSLPQKQ